MGGIGSGSLGITTPRYEGLVMTNWAGETAGGFGDQLQKKIPKHLLLYFDWLIFYFASVIEE
jgi:hypothetical protein